MNLIMVLLLIPLAANFIAEFSGLVEKFKYWLFYKKYNKTVAYNPKRLKPVDCAMCMSGHITWIWLLSIGYRNVLEIIILLSASATIAMVMNKLAYKL